MLVFSFEKIFRTFFVEHLLVTAFANAILYIQFAFLYEKSNRKIKHIQANFEFFWNSADGNILI